MQEVRNVFGYQRDFKEKYIMGRRIGSGSFGVVSIVVSRKSGQKFAVKAIPKVPRNRKCTSKYLKKIQNEVDCMKQLGASLSAVFLQVSALPFEVALSSACTTPTGHTVVSPHAAPLTACVPLPTVVQDVFEDDASVYMVMELCEGNGRLDRNRNGQRATEMSVAAIMKQVFQFLAQCHAKVRPSKISRD